ncbi:MAG: hypothetical protein K940chlam9_00314 [Chlamydiae bacterium]|nr:hypothetical protein [Chlamydiota bacterium]
MSGKKKELQNLIILLGSSVFVGFVAVVGLLYYFGSSGTYLLRNVLISPDAIEKVPFQNKDSPFVLNKIEFETVDMQGRQWGRYAVGLESYRAFYEMVENERSVAQLTDEMLNQFQTISPSTLTIFVQSRDTTRFQGDGWVFQQVEFLDNSDLFRVYYQRGVDGEGLPHEEWIYFFSPGILREVTELFAPTVTK